MCVIYGKQRISDTHTEFMESGVTALAGLRKQIHTSMERGGGKGGARKGELVHIAPSYLTWEIESCGPEPSIPVSGEEEGEQ